MHNLTRRTAIKTMGAAGASLVVPAVSLAHEFKPRQNVTLGVIVDLHGGLAVDAELRLDAFLDAMNQTQCNALVQLGDFAFPNDEHQMFADKFNAAHEHTLHVIGNHEFDFGLKRSDCFRAWGINTSYYRRDIGDLRVLVLDGNEAGSPTHRQGYPSYIGDTQKQWLADELQNSGKPVMILSHQPLAGTSAIDNAADIQQLLAQFNSKILLCLNGHSHVDSLVQVGGVPCLHINSASYFWVGGETRMAYYRDPLFTTITINADSATIDVAGSKSFWSDQAPGQLGYFERDHTPPESSVTPQIRSHHVSATDLKVMTWNIWGRLNLDARYSVDSKSARLRAIEIIEASGADVVAMIETYGSAADIASALGFHYHTPADDANLCIFSRYPLSDVELLEDLSPFSFIAATVNLPGGQPVRVYDIWLTSEGRHIVQLKDSKVSDDEFVRGDDNRFEHLKLLLEHPVFKRDMKAANGVPLIVAGDFNCVSHLDHTEASRNAGLNHSRVLPIQVSHAMKQAGFSDTYRIAQPHLDADTLGHTWTTVDRDYVYESGKGFVPTNNHPSPEYQGRYARIDYIYSLGGQLEVLDSVVITHHPEYTNRSFPEFPSDHAAVVTHFRVAKKP